MHTVPFIHPSLPLCLSPTLPPSLSLSYPPFLPLSLSFLSNRLGMLGSIDANTGSPDLGWDTDQFPMDVKNTTLIMKVCNYTWTDYIIIIITLFFRLYLNKTV